MLWGRIAKYVLWKAEEKWHVKGWGLSFGRQYDNEYTLRGMMWADNNWLFGDNREKLICKVNDIIEELFGFGHGAQAGIVVVDKRSSARRYEDLACGKQR